MKLIMPLPTSRNFEQIQNHYLVEKSISDRLKQANREERKLIYATMYDDLFRQVPDHPRLTRRDDEQLTNIMNKSKLALVSSYLDKSTIFAEFAPGDCRFALEVAKLVKFVYGIDISDQSGKIDIFPDNYKLIIYDGYYLEEISDNYFDIIFSDQLIEHLHPEDTIHHFELVYRILKKGGGYAFRTPHSFSGPHDISRFFSDKPEGFHLKEWTYIELHQMLNKLNFSHLYTFWILRGIKLKIPFLYFIICEKLLSKIPERYRKVFSIHLIRGICCVIIK